MTVDAKPLKHIGPLRQKKRRVEISETHISWIKAREAEAEAEEDRMSRKPENESFTRTDSN